jgi:hypothetical protein
MSTRLIVTQSTPGEGNVLIADVPDYTGPVPAVGQYIFHPPLHPEDSADYNGGIAGCVKVVTLAIYGRPQNGETYFTGRAEHVIEVSI